MASVLFSPIKIGNVQLKNHFMRSSCYMNGCDCFGLPKPWLLKYYQDMADGKMGLIIPGFFYLHQQGKASYGQAGIETDQQAYAWKKTVDYVHKQGSKMIFQVCDAGIRTTFDICREKPRGPTAQNENQRSMTKLEIAEVVEHYAEAALRIQNIGVDGIEIHAAHGYLVNQFLNASMNLREDEYGGSPQNRRRILEEIVNAIKSVVDKNFIVAAKIDGEDTDGGIEFPCLARTTRAVKGIDMYEVSCDVLGTTFTGKMIPIDSMKIVRESNPNVSLAVVGGFRKIKDMEEAHHQGADLIALGRPTIADPKVVLHLMQGSLMKCKNCGRCVIDLDNPPVKCYYA